MKTIQSALLFLGTSIAVYAHEWSAEPHAHSNRIAPPASKADRSAPAQATPFAMFAPKVNLRWDERYLYIESNGLPSHNMMVGITAWQQQVPLPQDYTGENAWRIPLSPVPAKEAATIRNRFLRGAIALAVNGIPIFNPQNNRGELSLEIGELDEWGGHCGRADDYHYHSAPLHLQQVVGKGQPIAFALDGYPIYGITEPDGSQPEGLDELNGHTTPLLGYHYHASMKYPYVNGGFHGEVIEKDGQLDPQPRANGVREALPALRGAKITGFESTSANQYKLAYEVNGDKRAVLYGIHPDGTVVFDFQNGSVGTTKEVYTRRQGEGGRRLGGDRALRSDNERGGKSRGGSPGDRQPPENRPLRSTTRFGPDAMKRPDAGFVLASPEFVDGGTFPIDYTGDGSGASPPLSWRGAPAGTRSYALLMDHVAPGNEIKHYWTMWDMPASVTSIPKNVHGIGKVGTGFRGQVGYEPPHSQGPGPKTYVITVFALSSPPAISQPPNEVDRDVLLAAMSGKVLASASLNVLYARGNSGPAKGRDQTDSSLSTPPPANKDHPVQQGHSDGGKGGSHGLVKPRIDDTMKLNVYADNWFVLYVNGRLVAVDPILFTPHNVVSVDFLPQYPMTIAVLAKDNADPKTGLEYGTSIGDGGFVLKFGDGTVSNASWKAKSFSHGPVNSDIANPKVIDEQLPPNWWSVDFDDSSWLNAREYTTREVDPKQPYFDNDFKDAKFIWSEDIALDNTVIFRAKIEKPDWTPRWNTKPDFDFKQIDLGASG